MERKKIRRSAWEYFLVGLTIAGSVLLSLAIYSKQDALFKTRLLILELQTLRNHVTAHTLEHRRHPPDLAIFSVPSEDPFGNPYEYEPATGRVWTTSPGYQNW